MHYNGGTQLPWYMLACAVKTWFNANTNTWPMTFTMATHADGHTVLTVNFHGFSTSNSEQHQSLASFQLGNLDDVYNKVIPGVAISLIQMPNFELNPTVSCGASEQFNEIDCSNAVNLPEPTSKSTGDPPCISSGFGGGGSSGGGSSGGGEGEGGGEPSPSPSPSPPKAPPPPMAPPPVVRTKVSVAFVAEGDVADYSGTAGEEKKEVIKQAFVSVMTVAAQEAPLSAEVTVQPASVQITVDVVYASAPMASLAVAVVEPIMAQPATATAFLANASVTVTETLSVGSAPDVEASNGNGVTIAIIVAAVVVGLVIVLCIVYFKFCWDRPTKLNIAV